MVGDRRCRAVSQRDIEGVLNAGTANTCCRMFGFQHKGATGLSFLLPPPILFGLFQSPATANPK